MSKFFHRSVVLALMTTFSLPLASTVLGAEVEGAEEAKVQPVNHGQGLMKRIMGLYNQIVASGDAARNKEESLKRFVQAMKFVLENDKGLRMERCKILKDLGNEATAKGSFLPTLAATASVGYDHRPTKKETKNVGSTSGTTWEKDCGGSGSVGIELRENIFSGGASVSSLKAATNANKAGYYQYKSKEGEAINAVFKIILEAVENLILRQANDISVQIYREIVHVALQKLKVGEIDRSEVAQAEVNLAKAESWAAEHRIRLEGLLGDVARKTGMTEKDLVHFIPSFAEFMPASEAEALQLAQKGNGNYLATHFEALAKKNAIAVARSGYFPSLDVSCGASGSKSSIDEYSKTSESGSYTKKDTRDTTNGANLSAALTLTWKLDTQGATRTAVTGAHHDYVQTTIAGAKVYSDLKSDISTDFANLKWGQDKVEAFKRHMKACEICFQSTLQELSAGAKVYVQVLKSLKDVMESYADLCKAQRTLAETQLRIMMNTGRLTPETFHTTGFVFDPANKETSYESPASRPQESPAKKKSAPKESTPQVVAVKVTPKAEPTVQKKA